MGKKEKKGREKERGKRKEGVEVGRGGRKIKEIEGFVTRARFSFFVTMPSHAPQ